MDEALQRALRTHFAELSHQLREDVRNELQGSFQGAHAPGGLVGADSEGSHAGKSDLVWGPLYLQPDHSKGEWKTFGARNSRSSRLSRASHRNSLRGRLFASQRRRTAMNVRFSDSADKDAGKENQIQDTEPHLTSRITDIPELPLPHAVAGYCPRPPPVSETPVTLFTSAEHMPGLPHKADESDARGSFTSGSGADRQQCGNWVDADSIGESDAKAVTTAGTGALVEKHKKTKLNKAERAERAIGLTARPRTTEPDKVEEGDADFASPMQRWVVSLVESASFEWFTMALICGSVLHIGLQTDFMARHTLDQVPLLYRVADVSCCVLFALELSLRVFAYRLGFFSMWGWAWNIFDLALVLLQVMEECLVAVSASGGRASSHFGSSFLLRIVRTLRVVRVLRILGVMRFTEELQLLVSCILHSVQSFMWAAILVFLMVYIMGIYLTQVVLTHRLESGGAPQGGAPDGGESSELTQWYGNVPLALLSLFQSLTGGVDWSDIVDPLIDYISPWLGVVMVLYMLFAIFVVMNLVTSIFVQSAIERAAEVKGQRDMDQAYEVFTALDADNNGFVSIDELERHLELDVVMDYFKSIDVDISEAQCLFRLLDVDNSGNIDIDEFLGGCVRLHGPARAVDLLLVSRDTRYAFEQQHRMLQAVETLTRGLLAAVSAPAKTTPQPQGPPASSSGVARPRPSGPLLLEDDVSQREAAPASAHGRECR